MIGDPICPDCGRPISSHELYQDGRCPVVRFPKATPEQIEELRASADGSILLEEWRRGHPEVPAEVCPRCGHTDEQHDEAGCYICGCSGP